MNKRILLLAFFLSICPLINAQEFAIGIKGGLNYYNIGDIYSRGGSIQAGKPDETFTPNNEMGYQFGAFFNVEFGKLFIRPELNFVTNKNSYDFPIKTSQWKATKTDVPLLIGYKIFDPIAIYVGPSFSFFSNMTMEGANNLPEEAPIAFEKTATSLMIGIQVEFKRFGVDLRYESGMKNTTGEFDDNWHDFYYSIYGVNIADIWSYKPSQISLSFNIFLFRTNADDLSGIFSGLFKSSKCWCPS